MTSPQQQAFCEAVRAALGNSPEHVEPGRMHRFATGGRPSDTAGWCKLFDDLAAGVYGCHRQGISETWTAARTPSLSRQQLAEQACQRRAAALVHAEVQLKQWQANAQRNADLWAQCEPLAYGDPCARYLRARGIRDLWPLPNVLRMHRALPYWNDNVRVGTFPALVAPLVDPYGRTVALHRTYVQETGTKAPVLSPKKLTAVAGPLAGACIPLYCPVDGRIGIAEGIETALAAGSASGLPTVAAYCAANLATWRWPAGLRQLVIFADADPAGRHAAETLRWRAASAGLRVNLLTPGTEGADWCDVWARRDAAGRDTRSAL